MSLAASLDARRRRPRPVLGEDKADGNRLRQLVRQRAFRSLARLHPDEFADLVELERIKAGLPPVGEANPWHDPNHQPAQVEPTTA